MLKKLLQISRLQDQSTKPNTKSHVIVQIAHPQSQPWLRATGCCRNLDPKEANLSGWLQVWGLLLKGIA